jgi:hypothetical protein
MAGDYDDAVFRPGKLRDDVVYGKFALGRIGGESVVLGLVMFKMRDDIVLNLFVICATERPRAIGSFTYCIARAESNAGGEPLSAGSKRSGRAVAAGTVGGGVGEAAALAPLS